MLVTARARPERGFPARRPSRGATRHQFFNQQNKRSMTFRVYRRRDPGVGCAEQIYAGFSRHVVLFLAAPADALWPLDEGMRAAGLRWTLTRAPTIAGAFGLSGICRLSVRYDTQLSQPICRAVEVCARRVAPAVPPHSIEYPSRRMIGSRIGTTGASSLR